MYHLANRIPPNREKMKFYLLVSIELFPSLRKFKDAELKFHQISVINRNKLVKRSTP